MSVDTSKILIRLLAIVVYFTHVQKKLLFGLTYSCDMILLILKVGNTILTVAANVPQPKI